jgi:regulator of sigma E protease
MQVFIQIAQFIFIISILVILHELGHFIPAKLFKTKVEKFYLFFDYKFSLFKKKIGDTVYGIGWIPFGGYVKISGMIDESMDTEQMKQPPQPWEFRSKPTWQRLIIMIGGVTVNFLLAWFIFSAMLMYYGENYIDNTKLKFGVKVDEIGESFGIKNGDKIISIDGDSIKQFNDIPINMLLGDKMTISRDGKLLELILTDESKKKVLDKEKSFINPILPVLIAEVRENSSAQKSGLLVGDEIVSINKDKIDTWNDFVNTIQSHKKDSLKFVIKRNETLKKLTVFVPDSAIIGVKRDVSFFSINKYSLLESIPKGLENTISSITKQVRSFKLIFNKKIKGYKKVKGPIGIVSYMSKTWDWHNVWSFMAMFSVWLAFLNLLPIPALDGGHIVFLLYEMITGRAPSEKVLEYAQIAGFIFIMGLMILVFGNDIYHAIFG